ncbi:MAG: hypothetical protein BMS9Abin13_479 [Patescibacteria group bacterium]|nr:MAG: hypothetical protein BMS9Abin13_479 [Patescibacteria group bacterium]
MNILKIIFTYFIFLIKLLFKFIFRIVIIFTVLYLVLHYVDIYAYINKDRVPTPAQVAIDYAKETPPIGVVKDIWDYVPLKDISLSNLLDKDSDVVFAINEDSTSPIGAVVSYKGGGGMVVYMKNIGGKRIMDRIIASDTKNNVSTLIFNNNGLPKKLEFAGYAVDYTEFRENTFDIIITDPEGNTEVKKQIPLNFTNETAMIPFVGIAHAIGADTVVKYLTNFIAKNAAQNIAKKTTSFGLSKVSNAGNAVLDFNDVKDPAYWTEAVNLAVNTGICAGGVLTILVPNPLSAGAITLGCGGVILDAVPVIANLTGSDFDPCNTKDMYSAGCFGELIKWVTGIENKAIVTDIFLGGSVVHKESKYRINNIENSKIIFTHKGGKTTTVIPDEFGHFGNYKSGIMSRVRPASLGVGAYSIVVTAPGFETLSLKGVVSSNRVKFIGNTTNYDEKGTFRYPSITFYMEPIKKTIEQDSKKEGGKNKKDDDEKQTTTSDAGFSGTYIGAVSTITNNDANKFPYLSDFAGVIEINIGDVSNLVVGGSRGNNSKNITCAIKIAGNSEYPSGTAYVSGPVIFESTYCVGTISLSNAKNATPLITLTGKHKSTGSDGQLRDDITFYVRGGSLKNGVINGILTTEDLSVWLGRSSNGIVFTLKKK